MNKAARKKVFDSKTAYVKARFYCAYQERCQQEVKAKLLEWSLSDTAADEVLGKLIEDGFVNEERFAKAFAGGKFRIKKWGKNKIKAELKKRKITDYCIRVALKEIKDEDYLIVLTDEIQKKYKKEVQKKSRGRYANESVRAKIIYYMRMRGFEPDLIQDAYKSVEVS